MSDINQEHKKSRFSGRSWRFFIMIALVILMVIPILMASGVIADRSGYYERAVDEVSRSWGGFVDLTGPYLAVPVEVTKTRKVKLQDGGEREEEYVEAASPVLLLPEYLQGTTDITTEMRYRGIFEVPVFSAQTELGFAFDPQRVTSFLTSSERALWERAELFFLTNNGSQNFEGAVTLKAGSQLYEFEPGVSFANGRGITASVGAISKETKFDFSFGMNGARGFSLFSAGRQTDFEMHSNWPHPKFEGDFLPTRHAISEAGFEAVWSIPHISRNTQQIIGGDEFKSSWQGGLRVQFYNPVNIYQKASRASKYGIMFIALSFLTVFLLETVAKRTVHSVQYLLIGAAQSVFFLLLVAFAEQIGFLPAYAIASAATIILIALYGYFGLKLQKNTFVLGAILIVLYTVLYLILKSADYALLAGSLIAFFAIALTMFFTRNENWSDAGE